MHIPLDPLNTTKIKAAKEVQYFISLHMNSIVKNKERK